MSEDKDQKPNLEEPEEAPEVETEGAPPESAPPEGEAPQSAEDEITTLRDQLLRTQAEMENHRKRLEREVVRVRGQAIENFAKDLLGVLDDIRRAQASWSGDSLDDSVKQGLGLILSSVEQMLARHAIRRMEALNTPFDPNFHEALFEDKESKADAGTITQIIEEGYMLGERLLRPARVAVASPDAPESTKPQEKDKNEGHKP